MGCAAGKGPELPSYVADERLPTFQQCLVSGAMLHMTPWHGQCVKCRLIQALALKECMSSYGLLNDICPGIGQVAFGAPSCAARHQGALRLCPCVPRNEQAGAATGTLLAGNNAVTIQPKDDQLQMGLVAAR
jgi:hypothetical protein